IVLAGLGVETTSLEVEAQRRLFGPTARTFANGSDIHALPLPQGARSPDYRPGAVGLEMPVTLNGPRSRRVEQAEAYAGRAGAVAEKTRNLIALEAEDAYLRYAEKRVLAEQLGKAAPNARAYADALGKKFDPEGKTLNPTLEDL